MTDGSVRFGVVLVWFIRKIRPTQLWVELSWVVAIFSQFILATRMWSLALSAGLNLGTVGFKVKPSTFHDE